MKHFNALQAIIGVCKVCAPKGTLSLYFHACTCPCVRAWTLVRIVHDTSTCIHSTASYHVLTVCVVSFWIRIIYPWHSECFSNAGKSSHTTYLTDFVIPWSFRVSYVNIDKRSAVSITNSLAVETRNLSRTHCDGSRSHQAVILPQNKIPVLFESVQNVWRLPELSFSMSLLGNLRIPQWQKS